MHYHIGATIERYGSLYRVERAYQLSDEYMKEHELYYKNRITIVKVSGVNGLDKYDYAVRKYVCNLKDPDNNGIKYGYQIKIRTTSHEDAVDTYLEFLHNYHNLDGLTCDDLVLTEVQ